MGRGSGRVRLSVVRGVFAGASVVDGWVAWLERKEDKGAWGG